MTDDDFCCDAAARLDDEIARRQALTRQYLTLREECVDLTDLVTRATALVKEWGQISDGVHRYHSRQLAAALHIDPWPEAAVTE